MSDLRTALPQIKTKTLPGPNAQSIIDRRVKAIPNAIRCGYPLAVKRGEGAMIEDVDGNIFLDWVGGVGVLNVGYSQPKMIEAVKAQADKYFHVMMNIGTHEGYVALAEEMNKIVPVRSETKKTMFVNSGAEADENAVKIAKGYTKRPNIIVFSGAFHGRTQMTMAMTSKKAYAYGMGPFPDGVYRAEFPYLYRAPKGFTEDEAIEYYIKRLNDVFEECSAPDYVAAIVVEPIQGEGGFVPAPIEWVKAVRKICDKHGILLVADEVQTGFARSGKMFVSQYWKDAGCAPDIMTSAKSIAAGMPLSAVTASAEIMDACPAGTIGGTFCGNAMSCAAGLEVIKFIKENNLCDRALEIGGRVMEYYRKELKQFGVVGDVRGIGAFVGLELVKDTETKEPYPELVAAMVKRAAQKGLIIESAGTYGNVIRFLCPLVVTDEQLEAGLAIMKETMAQSLEELKK
ncbi:MAG: aspartate aminotransferase family protein [Oscillospiraceae bacterium]|nr:aspartate aminotransferase family protein [Oscillospiraceae bacterium]